MAAQGRPFCYRRTTLRCLAPRIEGNSHYLRYLPPRGVVVWAEVGPVIRQHARLARPSALVATHSSAQSQALYPYVERPGRRNILVRLLDGRAAQTRRARHYLGYLPPC